jgi:CRISPR-associated endonuclease Csn1
MKEADAPTVGAYLAQRHDKRLPVRVRLAGAGKTAHYEFYPQRTLTEAEFDALWNAQAAHHPSLTDGAREELRTIMFRQRPLRPVLPGRCTLDPNERRAPWALPLAQHFRIHQELANLRIEGPGTSTRLAPHQRALIFAKLERKPKLTFTQMKRALKLDGTQRFNLESPQRDSMNAMRPACAWRATDCSARHGGICPPRAKTISSRRCCAPTTTRN